MVTFRGHICVYDVTHQNLTDMCVCCHTPGSNRYVYEVTHQSEIGVSVCARALEVTHHCVIGVCAFVKLRTWVKLCV